jgi:hypothetical protein
MGATQFDHEGHQDHVSGPGWNAQGPGGYVATDPEKTQITEEQAAAIKAEREAWQRRARNRALGYAVIAIFVIVLAIPLLVVLGAEFGLFVWCFNQVRHI